LLEFAVVLSPEYPVIDYQYDHYLFNSHTTNIMLTSKLIHPEISRILAQAGHHGTILIADGNYPTSSKRGPRSEVVSLNLMPGLVTCNQVLEAILSAIPVEAVQTMMTESSGPYALDGDPPVWEAYRETMRKAQLDLQLEPIEKWEFYKQVATDDHVLTVQTGDTQRYANILLTVGVRMFD
jgi:L-fucose mutarotase